MINKEQSKKLIQQINKYQNIIIAKHVSPDWDAQGSALGLKEIIIDNFANKKVYVVGSKLNSNELFEDEHSLTDEIIKTAMLITVDVADYDRIDFKKKSLLTNIFKIDHHLETDEYSKYKLVDESAISCTQVIAQWSCDNNLKLSQAAATYLFYGLITDSGRFLYNKTNEETFLTAINLLKANIKIEDIYDDLYLNDFRIKKWLNYAFKMSIFDKIYPIAYIKIKQKVLKKFKITEDEAKQALNVLSGIKQVEIWMTAYQSQKNKIKISIRSRKYNINKVAALYNGGGHKLASGATVNKFSQLKQVINDLKKLIDQDL